MKMKRFVAAAIAAVSCLSFAACGSDTASKDENVIHIMSSGDSSANMERRWSTNTTRPPMSRLFLIW